MAWRTALVVLAIGSGILPLLAVCAVQQGAVLTEELAFACQYAGPQRLSCDYRLITPEPVRKVSAELNDHALPVLGNRIYPQPGQHTAILVLVDSSAAQGSALIARRRTHLQRLFIAARPHHHFALARFNANLQVLQAFGSSRQELLSSLDRIGATQRPTALFRNSASAIKLLAEEAASRRALFIFSNGVSADHGLKDVIDRARAAGVTIYGVGYPQTPALISSLQALRRLSEESGGLFVSASADYELPPAFLSQPYQGIDNGAELLLDLSVALAAGMPKLPTLTLNFRTDTRQIRLPIPLAALESAPEAEFAALELRPVPAVQNSPPSSAARAASDRSGSDLSNKTPTEVWLRYGSPFAVGFLFLVGLLVYRAFKGGGKRVQSRKSLPRAFLVTIDEGSAPYPISGSPWIIGRNKESDLTLNDNSISRRHAELRRKPDGTFTITDLSSLNGLYVNNTKVLTAVLHDGDRVDIGDIRLRFVQH
ncbi:MAG: FHA domain-containing protein [Gammaproteobacteria bacterium]